MDILAGGAKDAREAEGLLQVERSARVQGCGGRSDRAMATAALPVAASVLCLFKTGTLISFRTNKHTH